MLWDRGGERGEGEGEERKAEQGKQKEKWASFFVFDSPQPQGRGESRVGWPPSSGRVRMPGPSLCVVMGAGHPPSPTPTQMEGEGQGSPPPPHGPGVTVDCRRQAWATMHSHLGMGELVCVHICDLAYVFVHGCVHTGTGECF